MTPKVGEAAQRDLRPLLPVRRVRQPTPVRRVRQLAPAVGQTEIHWEPSSLPERLLFGQQEELVEGHPGTYLSLDLLTEPALCQRLEQATATSTAADWWR